MRRLHPDAPIPPVYRTDGMFTNLRHLRETMGEDRFLEVLTRDAAGEEDKWGDTTFWTTERLDTALTAAEHYDDGTASHTLNLVDPTTPRICAPNSSTTRPSACWPVSSPRPARTSTASSPSTPG